MISIVIPLYNKSQSIDATIRSVLNQTFGRFEMIVIDDGSTDGSKQIVERIIDSRVRLISTPNQGVSAARNLGVDMAKYSYVAFLDADDSWSPSYLEKLSEAIKSNLDLQIFCSGRVHLKKTKSRRYSNIALPRSGTSGTFNYYASLLLGRPGFNSSSVIIKRSVLLDNRFEEEMDQFEDHELWFRICQGQRIFICNEPLSVYDRRINDNRASGKKVKYANLSKYFETMIFVYNLSTQKFERKLIRGIINKIFFFSLKTIKNFYEHEQQNSIIQLVDPYLYGYIKFAAR